MRKYSTAMRRGMTLIMMKHFHAGRLTMGRENCGRRGYVLVHVLVTGFMVDFLGLAFETADIARADTNRDLGALVLRLSISFMVLAENYLLWPLKHVQTGIKQPPSHALHLGNRRRNIQQSLGRTILAVNTPLWTVNEGLAPAYEIREMQTQSYIGYGAGWFMFVLIFFSLPPTKTLTRESPDLEPKDGTTHLERGHKSVITLSAYLQVSIKLTLLFDCLL